MHIMYHLILWSTSVRLHIRDTYANRHTHIYWLWSGGCPLIMRSQWGDREQRNTLNRKQVPSPGLVRQLHLWQWLRVFARMHVGGKWTTMKDSLWFIGTYQVSSYLKPACPWNNTSEEKTWKVTFWIFFISKKCSRPIIHGELTLMRRRN